ncbi:uncharacterized protein G2W53_029161 [Senna tora]|uniref:Uncharacterized protein n=1 Tax=Senna tora TaxID=362788 RepID=A0A834T769_9FABA|nr:uncharacterized protein G2W53_029161 [Senna tora]
MEATNEKDDGERRIDHNEKTKMNMKSAFCLKNLPAFRLLPSPNYCSLFFCSDIDEKISD